MSLLEMSLAQAAAPVVPASIGFHDLDASGADDFDLLDAVERERAQRFRFDRDRNRFICGRAYLRRSLGAALGELPERVALRAAPNGKPFVPDCDLAFNLAHSGSLAVLAMSRTADLGVDVELLIPDHALRRDVALLADRVLTKAEQAALHGLSEDRLTRAFLGFWTAKEARMKLTGEGLRLDPRRIALVLDGDRPTGYHTPETPAAGLWEIPVPAARAVCFLATSERRSG
jgi:4'-phosphopantetheinyl transferase